MEQIMEQPEQEQPKLDNDDGRPTDSSDGSKNEESILNKFATPEALAEAYKNLHAEFTRKSQELGKLVKTMQAEKQEKTGAVTNEIQQISPQPPNNNSDKGVQDTQGSREEVIREYLLSVATKQTAPAVIANPNTDFAFTNISQAKSMNAIDQIAKTFFETKGTLK
jgi:hypothetical protein